LFDLAGITCGHFGIPFKTFFSATSIGKAIIKVHIQMVFVIFIFTAHHVESLLNFVERNFIATLFPSFKDSLSKFLETQKENLHKSTVPGDKPLIAQIWDWVIFAMIMFFVISTINSLVGAYLEEEEAENQLKAEKGKNSKKKN